MKHHQRLALTTPAPAPHLVDIGTNPDAPPVWAQVRIDAHAADLAKRLMKAGETASEALEAARRDAAYRMTVAHYVERGTGYYVTTCSECDRKVMHDNYRDADQARGQACETCSPSPRGQSSSMADDRYVVVKGRTRKGKTTAEVKRRAGWSVVGSTSVRPSDLTDDQVAALAACTVSTDDERGTSVGISVDAWCNAWDATLSNLRRRSDGGFNGPDVVRAADTMLGRFHDAGAATGTPDRLGAANGLAWQQVIRLSPCSPVFARQRCGLSGYFDPETFPDMAVQGWRDHETLGRVAIIGRGPWDREMVASESGLRYVVERQTLATLGDYHGSPTVAGLMADSRYRLKVGRLRQSETVAWANPLRFNGWTVQYLAGPIMDDGRMFIGHALIERGAHAGSDASVASDQARQTVNGERVRTIRAAQTVASLTVEDLPTTVDGWEILADMLTPGERITFDGETVRGSLKRGNTGRYSGRLWHRDHAEPVKLAGVRSASAVARHLAALTS